VQARRAAIHDTAITFRAGARSSYETDYEVLVRLYYRPKAENDGDAATKSEATTTRAPRWNQIGEQTALLSEGAYLEATETGLETGRTYQYVAEAYLTNYAGPSRRVSPVREVTTGRPCSGPSTNCLRVETLAPEVSASGERVTLRASVRGLDFYDAVTGHFFYWRDPESKQWTEYVPVERGDGGDGGGDGGTGEGTGTGEFSATLSDLPAGTYTCYAEARGEGGESKNMYAEGEERRFTVE
jgi:hypothetical protein